MPKKYFICPDGQTHKISTCIEKHGCRMGSRCAPVPYLKFSGEDWKFKGKVSPSMAGTGARQILLKNTKEYSEKPEALAFASFGIHTHDRLSSHTLTKAVLSEERLSDEQITGIVDLLEEDEEAEGFYVLTDYKTWGSFSVRKALGIVETEVDMIDEHGNVVLYVRGPKKGTPKKASEYTCDPARADMRGTELQINRYRILIESYGFPVSRLQVYAIVRDGGTFLAKKRGIDNLTYLIPVRKLPDDEVLDYYFNLQQSVEKAFETGYAPKCEPWETWDGNRCDNYCPVREWCDEMP